MGAQWTPPKHSLYRPTMTAGILHCSQGAQTKWAHIHVVLIRLDESLSESPVHWLLAYDTLAHAHGFLESWTFVGMPACNQSLEPIQSFLSRGWEWHLDKLSLWRCILQQHCVDPTEEICDDRRLKLHGQDCRLQVPVPRKTLTIGGCSSLVGPRRSNFFPLSHN